MKGGPHNGLLTGLRSGDRPLEGVAQLWISWWMAISNAVQWRKSMRTISTSHPANRSTTLEHPLFYLQENDDGWRRQRAVVVVLRVLNTFKSFMRPKHQKNQNVRAWKVPVYRMEGPRLRDGRSPFTGFLQDLDMKRFWPKGPRLQDERSPFTGALRFKDLCAYSPPVVVITSR